MVTTKPTIFFSHSTRDTELLNAVKQMFCGRTGGAFDVFLSSDGSSIRFGHNWQKTIEEALTRAKLMFVFLSPLSVGSKWIYFESGFAFAKGMRVVPVAFEGVELDAQPPPLQLLQGFNMRDHGGLNNLVGIANEVFGHSHSLSFAPDDYVELLSKTQMGPTRAFGRYADRVESVVLQLACSEPQNVQVWTERYASIPAARELISTNDSRISLLGLRIWPFENSVSFQIDRLAVDRIYPVLESLLLSSSQADCELSVGVWFGSRVHDLDMDIRRSAALIGTDWSPSGRDYVKRCNSKSAELRFSIERHESEPPYDDDAIWLEVRASKGLPTLSELKEVVALCFDRELLTESSPTMAK